MYKLLTDKEKQKVEAEYRSRRSHAALTLMSLFLVFAIIAFSPALILALGRRNAATLLKSSAIERGASPDSEALTAWAKSERLELVALAPVAEPTPYEYFLEILKARPATVHLTSLSYAKANNSLSAKGVAPDRQTLLMFQTSLATSGNFSKVDFPVDNLAKDKDIDFQFTLTLH